MSGSVCFIIGLYHPPPSSQLLYTPTELLDYIRLILDDIATETGLAPTVILTGDFNQLSDFDVLSLGLINVVNQPTHHGHNLDRLYTSEPLHYTCKVVKSTVPTAHKAVIAVANANFVPDITKKSIKDCASRKRSPGAS